MKSIPMTMRGPVDDENFDWVKSHSRLYASQGEIGLQQHRMSRLMTPRGQSHPRSRTTGSVQMTSSAMESRDGRSAPVLPKIATGRSAHSAKKLYKDYETIKIRTYIQNELETPRIPPMYVPKNPRPLYKRPVDEMKPFNVLHLREFAERGEVDPEVVTDNSREFYANITFLRNAVRNTDGTTSYQNLCRRPRRWSSPTPMDDEPGLIKGNRLHWQSASSANSHPRMLLPLAPGPSTKWYAWKVGQQRNRKDKKGKKDGKHEELADSRRDFMEVYSPRLAPHPTPSEFKDRRGKGAARRTREEKNKSMEPRGVTFITEEAREATDADDNPTELVVTEDNSPSKQNEQSNEDQGGDGAETQIDVGNRPDGEDPTQADESGEREAEQPQETTTEGDGVGSEQQESNEKNESVRPTDDAESSKTNPEIAGEVEVQNEKGDGDVDGEPETNDAQGNEESGEQGPSSPIDDGEAIGNDVETGADAADQTVANDQRDSVDDSCKSPENQEERGSGEDDKVSPRETPSSPQHTKEETAGEPTGDAEDNAAEVLDDGEQETESVTEGGAGNSGDAEREDAGADSAVDAAQEE